jgi:hypothetical protein
LLNLRDGDQNPVRLQRDVHSIGDGPRRWALVALDSTEVAFVDVGLRAEAAQRPSTFHAYPPQVLAE